MLLYFIHKDPKKSFFAESETVPRVGETIHMDGVYYFKVKSIQYDFRKRVNNTPNTFEKPSIIISLKDYE